MHKPLLARRGEDGEPRVRGHGHSSLMGALGVDLQMVSLENGVLALMLTILGQVQYSTNMPAHGARRKTLK